MSLNTIVREELINFSTALAAVKYAPDLRAPMSKVKDLGLVIFDKNLPLKGLDVQAALPESTAYHFLLNDTNDYLLFSKFFFVANAEGRDLVVSCEADPSPRVITALKGLSERNVFAMPNFNKAELFTMPLGEKTRLIFCINEATLESGITYPNFTNLFGAVLKIQ